MTEFAQAVIVPDGGSSSPKLSGPVVVVDLPGTGRVSIYAAASPALAAATLKALR
jgi:transposase